ncbi:MAG: hypothetical protein ACOYOH_22350, partial [Paracraurococcus sp.]
MRWVRGAALTMGLLACPAGMASWAQPKPPPLDAPATPAGRVDKFGEPLAEATPAAPPAARPTAPRLATPAAPPTATPAAPPAATPAAPPAATPSAPPAATPSAPPAATPAPAAAPADALPGVARFRAMLGSSTGLTYRSAAPIDPATGSVRLMGAVLTRGEGRMAIEELTLDGLGEQRIDAASAREVTLSGPDSPTARVARLELRGLAAAQAGAAELVLDQLRLETLTVEGDTPVAIAEILLEDYAAGRPGRITVSGIDVLVPQAGSVDRVRVGRVALRGLDLPGTIAAMEAQAPPPRAATGYALEVEDVAAMLGSTPVAGLGALRLQGDPAVGDVESGRLALRELRVEPSPVVEEWLRRLGYPALVADLTAESRYDRSSGRLELGSLALAGRDMGVLALSLVLDGATPEAAEAQAWEQVTLVGLTLRYLDQSLYGRAVRDQAR